MKAHWWRVVLTCLLASSWLPASAQTSPGGASAASGWQELATADLDAAYRLIRDSHPGAAEVLGDDAFRSSLERGHAAARARIGRVDSFQGYAAVLAGFATAFGDEHIWTNTKLRGVPYRWAGLVMSRQGGHWVVASQATDPVLSDTSSLEGATLVACDGTMAEEFAKERLAFRLSAPIEAQYVAHGGFLFVDDGNPFLAEPRSCTFEMDGNAFSYNLFWRPVATQELAKALQAAVLPASAGFGLRQVDGLAWVSLERLDANAEAVLEQVAAERESLLGSPTIVVDVRGNGGGDSLYGRRLAALIYGQAFLDAKLSVSSVCGAVWRASEGNARHLRALAATASDAAVASHYREIAARMDTAMSIGMPFESPIPTCEDNSHPAQVDARPDFQGRVILLTDHSCFSSCLLLTQDFLRLGALHVGTQTNAATRYMEVREIDLPSGLSTFSTLQKVAVGSKAEIGPFTPQIVSPVAIGDTPALEQWLASLD